MAHEVLDDGLKASAIDLEVGQLLWPSRERWALTMPSTRSSARMRIDMSGSSTQLRMVS